MSEEAMLPDPDPTEPVIDDSFDDSGDDSGDDLGDPITFDETDEAIDETVETAEFEADETSAPELAGDIASFKRAIEAIVLVAHDPVAPDLMAQLLEQPVASVERWCDELQAEYAAEGRGFQLARVAGGYRYQTHPDETPYVERFVLNDQRARLSGAALETLAIIAYKQPISRAQVASIRGVDPDGVIRTLAARGYIDEVGRDNGPGQAVLFGTTQMFLEKLGLDSLDNLPPIAEFIPDAEVVEALEQGLRVRPQVDVSDPDEPADTVEPASEVASPEPENAAEPEDAVAAEPASEPESDAPES